MKLQKRLRALEAITMIDPVILFFADGTTRQIHGRGDFLLDLLAYTCGGNPGPHEAAQLELIRASVDAQEPSAGHMVELIRALLH